MPDLNAALQQLHRFGSTEEALALLELLEEKKRKEQFIRFWEPIAGQKDVFPLFTKDIKELYVLGGNRSGKTVIGAAIAMAFLLGKDYFKDEPAWEWVKDLPIPEGRPRNIWVVGLDFSVVRDVIWKEKLITGKGQPAFLPKNFEELGGKIKEGDTQLIAPDGSTLTCKSADSGREKFQGASVDLVWIDEECDVTVYEECFQRTVDCGGFILVTLTPLTDTSSGAKVPWVFQRVTEGRGGDPDIKVAQLSVLDNPFIPEKEKERLKTKWAGHAEERARLYGDFIQRSGLVYPMLSRRVHFCDKKPLPKDMYRVVCIDPAPSGFTAALWATVEKNPWSEQQPGDLRFFREYKIANQVVSEHAKNILAVNGGEPIDMWIIDPWGGNQRNPETHKTIAQLYRENGIPVRFPNLDEDFGREALREYFNATLDPTNRNAKAYIDTDLRQFEEELFGYVWDFYARGEKKGLSKEKPLKRNDHLINCAQYIAGMRLRGKRARYGDLPEEVRRAMARNNSYT
jgi:phage terminase large subunit-like protein